MAENIINRNLQNIQDPDTEMNQMIPEANNFAFDIGSRVAPLGTFFAGTDYRSSNMDKNIMDIISNQGTQKGTIGYQDYDPKQPSNTAFPDLDGMMSRYLSGEISPSQFGNATQTGRMNYNLDPNTGQYNFTGNKYDFRPDVADQGGIFGYFANKANERGMNINPGSSTKAGYLSDYEAGEHYNMTPEPADAISRTNFNDSYNYNDVDALTADEQAQLPFDRITPQQTMFGKARDLASAGIGKAGKLGMDVFNTLKNNNPMGLISSGLGGLTNMLGGMFEDKQLYADTYDEFGNKYTADQLNSMNARGGYYTDPARASRRRQNSIYRMEKRKADGKKIGENRLATLKAIEEKAQEARDKATADKVAAFQKQRAAETGAGSWGTGDEANTFGENIGSGGWDSYT
jgi:hypothetical protein